MIKKTKFSGFLAFGVLSMNFWAMAATPKMPTFFARRDYPGISGDTTGFVQVADTNGDGIPDLISMAGGLVTVWLGKGGGTFQPYISSVGYPELDVPFSFAVGDVNGDGKVDLVAACPRAPGGTHGSIQVLLGNGDGTFQSSVIYTMDENQLTHVVLGDFNGDGIPDIVATGANAGVWLLTGVGNGTFHSPVVAISLPEAFNLASADFNGDGKPDLAVGIPAGFDVFLGNGNGTFQPPQAFSTPTGPVALVVGSLTPGGPLGIAVNGGESNEVYLYAGNGAGGFSAPETVSLPGGFRDDLALGDINGDGIPDLVSTVLTDDYTEGFVYAAFGRAAAPSLSR